MSDKKIRSVRSSRIKKLPAMGRKVFFLSQKYELSLKWPIFHATLKSLCCGWTKTFILIYYT